MEWWQVYLWTRLDGFIVAISVIGILLGIGVIVLTMVGVMEEDVNIKSMGKRLIKWCVFFLSLAVFVPSKSDIALMYVIPRIADSQAIQQDLPELYDLAVKRLKGMLEKEE